MWIQWKLYNGGYKCIFSFKHAIFLILHTFFKFLGLVATKPNLLLTAGDKDKPEDAKTSLFVIMLKLIADSNYKTMIASQHKSF